MRELYFLLLPAPQKLIIACVVVRLIKFGPHRRGRDRYRAISVARARAREIMRLRPSGNNARGRNAFGRITFIPVRVRPSFSYNVRGGRGLYFSIGNIVLYIAASLERIKERPRASIVRRRLRVAFVVAPSRGRGRTTNATTRRRISTPEYSS